MHFVSNASGSYAFVSHASVFYAFISNASVASSSAFHASASHLSHASAYPVCHASVSYAIISKASVASSFASHASASPVRHAPICSTCRSINDFTLLLDWRHAARCVHIFVSATAPSYACTGCTDEICGWCGHVELKVLRQTICLCKKWFPDDALPSKCLKLMWPAKLAFY
eukprot:533633-Pelagomonas_calceolata.AAC.1